MTFAAISFKENRRCHVKAMAHELWKHLKACATGVVCLASPAIAEANAVVDTAVERCVRPMYQSSKVDSDGLFQIPRELFYKFLVPPGCTAWIVGTDVWLATNKGNDLDWVSCELTHVGTFDREGKLQDGLVKFKDVVAAWERRSVSAASDEEFELYVGCLDATEFYYLGFRSIRMNDAGFFFESVLIISRTGGFRIVASYVPVLDPNCADGRELGS